MNELEQCLKEFVGKMSNHEMVEEAAENTIYICIFRNQEDAASFTEVVKNYADEVLHRELFVRVTFKLLNHELRRSFAKYMHKASYSMWNRTREIQLVNDREKYFMLGYYARHAWLKARPTARAEHSFVGDYFSIKYDDPVDKPGYGIDICPKTWSLAMHIRFPIDTAPKNITYPRDAKVIEKKTTLFIYHTDWCWQLLNMGFDVGNNHDVEEILEHVPDTHKEEFYRGYNYSNEKGLR